MGKWAFAVSGLAVLGLSLGYSAALADAGCGGKGAACEDSSRAAKTAKDGASKSSEKSLEDVWKDQQGAALSADQLSVSAKNVPEKSGGETWDNKYSRKAQEKADKKMAEEGWEDSQEKWGYGENGQSAGAENTETYGGASGGGQSGGILGGAAATLGR